MLQARCECLYISLTWSANNEINSVDVSVDDNLSFSIFTLSKHFAVISLEKTGSTLHIINENY